MVERSQRTQTTETILGKDGIIRIRSLPGTSEDLSSAQANVALCKTLCEKGKKPVLVNLSGSKGATQEARHTYSSKEFGAYISAAAIVVCTPISKVIGSFYLGLNRPIHPIKLFESEDPAIEWLSTYL